MAGLTLPDYPWDTITWYRQRAAEHPGGTVDLSIGTPVDPTPDFIRDALKDAADAHGYPTTNGTTELREAVAAWYVRRRGVDQLDPAATLPTVGSKEFIAWLPTLLGLSGDDLVMRPTVAYPTYDMGATLAGVESIPADDFSQLDPSVRARVKLVWVNSPGNPTGAVRTASDLADLVAQAREIGAVVASDECYAELGWDAWDAEKDDAAPRVPCLLAPEVAQGSHSGLLSVYSLSKQSNLAGYRAAFAAGDAALIANLTNSRKHAGMMVPAPIQAAMTAGLGNDAHVRDQKDVYRRRRELLKAAVEGFGLRVEYSEAGLYLWVTPAGEHAGEDSWATMARLAELGIVAGPGDFYGDAGKGFVRMALTASDERVAAAAQRLGDAS